MIISKITNAVFISNLILSNDSITINDLITINGSQMPPSNQERQKIVGCYFSNSDYTHTVYIQGVRAKESKLYIAQELFVPLQPFLPTSLWRQPLLPVSCVCLQRDSAFFHRWYHFKHSAAQHLLKN